MTAGPAASTPRASHPGGASRRLAGGADFGRRFMRHREGLLGLAIIGGFAVLAIAPELFVGPLQSVITATGSRLEPPG